MILIGIGILLFVVGIFLGTLLRPSESRRFAIRFSALGTLVGLLIGMSESPVVAGLITAGFGLVATLLTFFKEQSEEDEDGQPWEGRWMVPLVVGTLVGMLLGVVIRANDVLDFRDTRLDIELRRLGFNESQTKTIMERFTQEISMDAVAKPSDQSRTTLKSGKLTSNTPTQTDWPQKWINFDQIDATDEEVLASLEETEPWLKPGIEKFKKEGKSDQEIVVMIRKLTGGSK